MSKAIEKSLIFLRTLGAFSPSSQYLADDMTRFIDVSSRPRSILEVGAGTGAITKTIVKKINEQDHVDVVEIMPKLSLILKRRFGNNPRVTIHSVDFLSFVSDKKYDLIISSLPFNSLPPEVTEKIIARLECFSKSGTILSFFEYKLLQRIGLYMLTPERLEQYRRSRELIDQFLERFAFDSKKVVLNLPPALVHYLRF